MSKLKPENLEILTRKKMYVKEDIWKGRYIFRGRKIQSFQVTWPGGSSGSGWIPSLLLIVWLAHNLRGEGRWQMRLQKATVLVWIYIAVLGLWDSCNWGLVWCGGEKRISLEQGRCSIITKDFWLYTKDFRLCTKNNV